MRRPPGNLDRRSVIEGLARAGYAARGIVYAVIGILALRLAFGEGGRTTGAEGALSEIARGPLGRSSLLVIAIGLAGYVVWRFVQAIADVEHDGKDAEGIAKRGVRFGIGVIYAGLALYALQVFLGAPESGGEERTRDLTARVMSQPFGVWLVGLAGVAMGIGGLVQIRRGYRKRFLRKLDIRGLAPRTRRWAIGSSRFGLIARGVVFLMIGGFLVQAAATADPSEARGLGGALATLAAQSYGPILLAIAAAGLVAFGIYSGIEARFRRIAVPA